MLKASGERVNGGRSSPRLELEISANPDPPISRIPLSASGAIRQSWLDENVNPSGGVDSPSLLLSGPWNVQNLVAIWERVVLTSAEELVLRAIRLLDPEIERIAALPLASLANPTKGGFIVSRKGFDGQIPIGSLGDGVWHSFGLALSLSQCRGNALIVDEIDGGLHHSAMADIWRLIYRTAKDLDVQVFATTHSWDCVSSLAEVCAETDEANPITVQRIESGPTKTISYGEDEIRVAAERGIEVR
jgi:hypothetical protein